MAEQACAFEADQTKTVTPGLSIAKTNQKLCR